MRGRGGIVAVALVSLVGCGPPRQTSIHTLDVGGVVESLAFAPDGRTLACALGDRVLLVDAERGTRIRELGPLPAQYLLVAFSRERLLSAGTDGYVRLWDVSRGVEMSRVLAGEVRHLAISPDGRWLVTTPSADWGEWRAKREGPITIWDLDHERRSPPIHGLPCAVQSLAVSADGLVAVGRSYQKIDVFEARTGKLLHTLLGGGSDYESIGPLAFSPEVPRLLAAADSFGVIALLDVVEGRLLTRTTTHVGDPLAPTSRITAMAFAAQGILAAGGSRGVAEVWRVSERPDHQPRSIARLSDHATLERLNNPALWASANALAVNRDGSLIATSYEDHKVRIWRGPGGR